MRNGVKPILIIIAMLVIFAALIFTKWYLSSAQYLKRNQQAIGKKADLDSLQQRIKADSLYDVKQVIYKDSAILITLTNPDKSGTDRYFNTKYNLNGYDNINMVYIYAYNAIKSLDSVTIEDALMGTGKRLGKFQEQWVNAFIDTTDQSCRPLKKYIQATMRYPESFKNQETIYQPENIHRMQVVCKFRGKDSTGTNLLKQVTAEVSSDGAVLSTQYN